MKAKKGKKKCAWVHILIKRILKIIQIQFTLKSNQRLDLYHSINLKIKIRPISLSIVFIVKVYKILNILN